MSVDDLPTTPAALYDYLQRHWGAGSWDEVVSDGPWFKARAIEIGKIKRSLTSRGVTVENAGLAAVFCRAHRYQVVNVAWLYRHIMPARRWWREQQEAAKVQEFDSTYEAAISAAWEDEEWRDRLLTALGPERAKVLADWQAARDGRLL